MQSKINKALDFAYCYGQIDGDHHKEWVIDQMVRALTGCPVVTASSSDANGKNFEYETQGESEEYQDFLRAYAQGEDGPHTYSWGIGIAP